jgi:hypothetical protein
MGFSKFKFKMFVLSGISLVCLGHDSFVTIAASSDISSDHCAALITLGMAKAGYSSDRRLHEYHMMLGGLFSERMKHFDETQHFADFGMGEGRAIFDLFKDFSIGDKFPRLTGFGFEEYPDSRVFQALKAIERQGRRERIAVHTGQLFSALNTKNVKPIDVGVSVGGIFSYTNTLSYDLNKALNLLNSFGGQLYLSFNLPNLNFQDSSRQVLPLSRFFNRIAGVDVRIHFIDSEPWDLVQVVLTRTGGDISVPETTPIVYRDPGVKGQPVYRVFRISD